jgi:hypothetical protein
VTPAAAMDRLRRELPSAFASCHTWFDSIPVPGGTRCFLGIILEGHGAFALGAGFTLPAALSMANCTAAAMRSSLEIRGDCARLFVQWISCAVAGFYTKEWEVLRGGRTVEQQRIPL